jgi:hypothetical protein
MDRSFSTTTWQRGMTHGLCRPTISCSAAPNNLRNAKLHDSPVSAEGAGMSGPGTKRPIQDVRPHACGADGRHEYSRPAHDGGSQCGHRQIRADGYGWDAGFRCKWSSISLLFARKRPIRSSFSFRRALARFAPIEGHGSPRRHIRYAWPLDVVSQAARHGAFGDERIRSKAFPVRAPRVPRRRLHPRRAALTAGTEKGLRALGTSRKRLSPATVAPCSTP